MYNPVEISRIDRQIEDLQRLKANYQAMPQPINNIINTPTTTQPIFEARFTTENPSDIYVQNKTAFIDLKNGKLSIKEPDGELKEYYIILPKDEKDLKIENLERKLREMETKMNNVYANQQPQQYPDMTADTINNTYTTTYTTTTVNAENSTDFSDSNMNNSGTTKKNGKLKFGK